MSLYSIVLLLIMMSIPIIGGALLYCEFKWDVFHEKSIGYSFIYALIVMGLLTVDSNTRFIGNLCDKIALGSDIKVYFQDLAGIDETLAYEAIDTYLKSHGCDVMKAYVENHMYNRRFLVFNYKGPNIKHKIIVPDLPKNVEIKRLQK